MRKSVAITVTTRVSALVCVGIDVELEVSREVVEAWLAGDASLADVANDASIRRVIQVLPPAPREVTEAIVNNDPGEFVEAIGAAAGQLCEAVRS